MVLFSERETLLLLDVYAFLLRQGARNVTAGGLLRQHARRRLARALNRRCARESPWTEAQLAVKVKNLRIEYAELRWLAQQPGFEPSGAGLSAAWWAAVKLRRPKARAFKGKLPWAFERRVALLVGDLPLDTRVASPAEERVVAQLVAELDAEDGVEDVVAPVDERAARQQGGQAAEAVAQAETARVDRAVETLRLEPPDQRRRTGAAQAVASIDHECVPPSAQLATPSPASRKRAREEQQQQQEEEGAGEAGRTRGGRRSERLADAVQQSSAAAAGMARGLQELVVALQEQSARYARLATLGDHGEEVEHQRRVVQSVARALEQSTRAAADMALGFHDLVRLLVRERAAEAGQE